AKPNRCGRRRQWSPRARQWPLLWLVGAAALAVGTAGALAAAKHVSVHKSTTAKGKHHKHSSASDKERRAAQRRGGAQEEAQRIPLPRERPPADGPAADRSPPPALPPHFAAVT